MKSYQDGGAPIGGGNAKYSHSFIRRTGGLDPRRCADAPARAGAQGILVKRLFRTAAVYATFVLLPGVALLWVLHSGHNLPAAINPVFKAVDRGPRVSFQTSLFLTQIIIILTIARLLGGALRKLGQPRVVGEMLAGLILGPSLLGAVSPDAYGWLFPPGMIRPLNALSQTGIVLFMFLIGLELNVREMMRQSRESRGASMSRCQSR